MNIIAIEGIDGSGKSCQAESLKNKLIQKGFKVEIIDFPNYENSFFGKEIGKILKGDHEINPTKIDVKSMCLWYCLDRFVTLRDKPEVAENDFLIFNRYTLSNIAHQGSRTKYYDFSNLTDWIFNLEHNVLNLPKPNLYFILDIDLDHCKQNIKKKKVRNYLGKKDSDLYEKDTNYLINSRECYLKASKRYLNSYVINCLNKQNKLKNIEEISKEMFIRTLEHFKID